MRERRFNVNLQILQEPFEWHFMPKIPPKSDIFSYQPFLVCYKRYKSTCIGKILPLNCKKKNSAINFGFKKKSRMPLRFTILFIYTCIYIIWKTLVEINVHNAFETRFAWFWKITIISWHKFVVNSFLLWAKISIIYFA